MATPDIKNADGSMYDVKTIKTKNGEVEYDTNKLADSIDWICSTPRGSGKSFANLYQQSLNQMMQTMAIPSIMLGSGARVTATQSQGRQFRDEEEEKKKYAVSRDYPYSVERIEVENESNSPLVWLYWYTKKENRHYTRMEAEKDSLTMFIAYHKKQYHQYTNVQSKYHRRQPKFSGYSNMNINAKKTKAILDEAIIRLENLEEDHPEWLI